TDVTNGEREATGATGVCWVTGSGLASGRAGPACGRDSPLGFFLVSDSLGNGVGPAPVATGSSNRSTAGGAGKLLWLASASPIDIAEPAAALPEISSAGASSEAPEVASDAVSGVF
ncbi:MAG: hypothetical protein ABJB97_13315, partial [Acidobacteriota bacterium]